MNSPPLNDPFVASFTKISRAKMHITEIEQMVSEYLATDPAKVAYDPAPPAGMKTGFQFHMSVTGPPVEMSAVIGDIIHNLRASLDLMASDLCRLNGNSADSVYFPFCKDGAELEGMIKRRNFDLTGDAAVKLLHELKPYKGGNDMLRALHDLDVQDKHQMLIPAATSVGGPIMEIHNGDGVLYRDEHGQPKPKIFGDPNKPSSVAVHFPGDSVFAGKDLIQTLHDLVHMTTSIVESFKALR